MSLRSVFRAHVDETVRATAHAACVRELLEADPHSDRLLRAIRACQGGWSIDHALARVLANAVTRADRRHILEFGAGSSSVLLATALHEIGGGRLTSVEQDPTWCADRWREVGSFNDVDSMLVASPPVDHVGRLGWFAMHRSARSAVRERAPYDLVLIDGPQHYRGRDGAMPLAYDLLAPGCLIVMDDASRSGERLAIWKWLKSYPGLSLEHYDPAFNREGIAILKKHSDTAPRFAPAAFVVGVLQGYERRRSARRPPQGGEEVSCRTSG
jgi:predicted O-methyltransferase YrrM